MSIAKYIDHTNLKPYVTSKDIKRLCREAIEYQFRGVCVHSSWLPLVCRRLAEYLNIKVSTVVGFPLGASSTEVKVKEALYSWEASADEIDVVWNIGLFKEKRYLPVVKELESIVQHLVRSAITVKVIVETCYLDVDEIDTAHQIVKDSGAFCIKTSTGFGTDGAEAVHVERWKELGDLKIKASGGIRDYATASGFIGIGADILGTSHGVKIVKEEQGEEL